jgi:hypothetical protein
MVTQTSMYSFGYVLAYNSENMYIVYQSYREMKRLVQFTQGQIKV